jgi:Zn-dependent peptidase ImmA (M78 family)
MVKKDCYGFRKGGLNMQKGEVHVSPDIWRWVLSTVNVEDDFKDKIDEWIKGIKLPTITQLEKFGKKTHIPIGFFFLKTPPTEKCKLFDSRIMNIDFRTIDSAPLERSSRDLFETAMKMERIQVWMREYLLDNGVTKPNDYVGSLATTMPKLNAANSIRDVLRIDIKWYEHIRSAEDSFKFFRKVISDAGVLIFKNGKVGNNTHRKLDINEFRAFALIDGLAPLIFINSSDSPEGKAFSLIHEFVHIGLGDNNIFNLRQDNYSVTSNEAFCNGVAAEILIPIVLFRGKWNENSKDTDTRIAELSRYFKCSQLAIARRALDSGFLTREQYFQASQKAKMAIAKKRAVRSDYYRTKSSDFDHNFLLALYSSVSEGKTLFTDAYRLTDTNISTFDKLLSLVCGEHDK